MRQIQENIGVEGNFFQDEEKFKVLKHNASSDTYSEEEKPKYKQGTISLYTLKDAKSNEKSKKNNQKESA